MKRTITGPFFGPQSDKGGAKAADATATQAAIAATTGDKATSITLPSPVFALVANPKAYLDRNDQSKSNTKIATVELTSGLFTLTGSIYLETAIEQTASGRRERKGVRFSMPKNTGFSAIVPEAMAGEFKEHVITEYLAWQVKHGRNVAGLKPQAGFRPLTEDMDALVSAGTLVTRGAAAAPTAPTT